jgi:hypothetical protein
MERGFVGLQGQRFDDLQQARSFYRSSLSILDEFPGLHESERMILRANLQEL